MVPPKSHIHRGGVHWVERIDYDGRSQGLEVYQWQPSAQKWCRINEYDTGGDLELVNYRWVAVCPMPVFKEEYLEVKATLEKIRDGKEVTAGEMGQFVHIFHEQVFPRS